MTPTVRFTLAGASRVMGHAAVTTFALRPFTVDLSGYDIPALVGYSLDGSKIYLDRQMPPWIWDGSIRIVSPFLTLRGLVEKSIIDAFDTTRDADRDNLTEALGMTVPIHGLYMHARGVARALEEHAVRTQFGHNGWEDYMAFVEPLTRRAEDPRNKRIPADLDLTPYNVPAKPSFD